MNSLWSYVLDHYVCALIFHKDVSSHLLNLLLSLILVTDFSIRGGTVTLPPLVWHSTTNYVTVFQGFEPLAITPNNCISKCHSNIIKHRTYYPNTFFVLCYCYFGLYIMLELCILMQWNYGRKMNKLS